jgi:hypothetical protein
MLPPGAAVLAGTAAAAELKCGRVMCG